MARQIITDDEFFAVPITSGTIQNIGTIPVELSNGTTPGEGIVLNQGESYQWDNTAIYVRKTRSGNARAQIAYVPFKKSAGGGGSSSYVLPVASASVLGGVKSSNATGKISVNAAGVMTYNAPETQPLEAPEWEQNTAYVVNALVEHNDDVYMCLVAHTSGTDFDADLAANNWKLVGLALKVATETVLGGVKANDDDGGVSVASDGKMTINLPTASATVKGGVKVGTGVEVVSQKLNVIPATASAVGGVKSSTDDGKVAVGTDGTMSVNDDGYVKHVEEQTSVYTDIITIKKPTLTKGTAPSVVTGTSITLRDKDNNGLGYFYAQVRETGNNIIGLQANNFNGNDSTAITLHYDADGKKYLVIPTPEQTNNSNRAITGEWFRSNGHYDNAASHNAHYRGKDLTSYMDSGDMSTAIANGSFVDIYPGDYVTKSVTIDGTTYSNVKWIVMALDYFLNLDDYKVTTHHVVLMPEEALGTAPMNATNTTAGGFLGSDMWTTTIPLVNTGIESAFGATHVLTHREILTNAVETTAKASGYSGWNGAASGNEWTTVKANLASEGAVFGTMEVSSSWRDGGTDSSQFAAFRYNHSLICSKRYTWWLRAVANTTDFCTGGMHGRASFNHASENGSIRPYFLYR